MDSKMVPTFILQSDDLFREGLRLLLSKTQFRPHGCGVDLEDFPEVPSDRPVLFLVGVLGPAPDLICRRIKTEYPLSTIVAVGDQSHHEQLTSMLGDGANAVLFNSVTPNALVKSLYAVMNQELFVIDARLWSPDISATRTQSPPIHGVEPLIPQITPDVSKQLSAREIAILERIVRGDSNKHAARFFGIAEATVKAHVKTIFRKIGATNRTQAAIWAIDHDLFHGPGTSPEVSIALEDGHGNVETAGQHAGIPNVVVGHPKQAPTIEESRAVLSARQSDWTPFTKKRRGGGRDEGCRSVDQRTVAERRLQVPQA